MEKYVLDYSETSYFKGLRILYPYRKGGKGDPIDTYTDYQYD